MELTFNERRVLGVLIEKGFTTPEQYPLSLNSLTLGANQKSCRDPMTGLGEDVVLDTLDSLRSKGLVTLVRSTGSRVDRYRHTAGDAFTLSSKELALLAELFLRGPQTDGELRQRATRMIPFESLDEVRGLLDGLGAREESFVAHLGPPGRRRGVKYAHTFYEAGEPEAAATLEAQAGESGDATMEASTFAPPSAPLSAPQPPSGGGEIAELRRQIEDLDERLRKLEEQTRDAGPVTD
jgi:uncharacterized protein YceH (UPF0502 family)